MQWLFLLGVLVCAIVFPGFRKVLIVLALVVAAVIAYFLISHSMEESASKNRIAPSEVELVDPKLVKEYSSYTLRGRVRNKSSKYTLSDFKLRVTLEDCIGDRLSEETRKRLDGIIQRMIANKESDANIQVVVDDFKKKYSSQPTCDIVWQESRSPLILDVPPGQARDFEISSIGSYDMQLKGFLKWYYSLVEVRGR